MNFRQPQRLSPGVPSRPGVRRLSNGSLSVDERDASGGGSSGGHIISGSSNGAPSHSSSTRNNDEDGAGDPPLTVTKMDSRETDCGDPPIANYESPNSKSDDDDGDGSISSESSHRARRRRLRELAAQSDDCWAADLSDDEEGEALPLEWNSNMVRRRMMNQSSARGKHAGNGGTGAQPQHTQADPNVRNESCSSNGTEEMSLPEQLLQKRLRRKERMQRKHEQFARYQQHRDDESPPKQTKNRQADALQTPEKLSSGEVVRSASPLFPDEEFDDDNASTVASSNGASNDYSHLRPQHEQNEMDGRDTSPLRSLPRRPICPFPEEADRKRVVGCLAAVLASSYAYETAPHLLVKEEKAEKRISEADTKKAMYEVDAEKNAPPSVEISDTLSEEGSMDGRSFDGSVPDDDNTHLQQHKKQQQLIQQSRESQQQQQSRSSAPLNGFTAAFQKNKRPSFNSRSHSSGDLIAKKSAPNPMASLQQSFSFASFNNNTSAARLFDKPGSTNPPPSLEAELAEIRHRIRRHAVLSELLVSSAEMLMLDPSHARAFLPMLEGLLTKVEAPEENINDATMDSSVHSLRQSWKGRGFGGGGVPRSPSSGDGKHAALVQPSSSNSPPRPARPREATPAPSSPPPSEEGPNASPMNAGLESISEKSMLGGDASKPGEIFLDVGASKPSHTRERISSSRSQSTADDRQRSSGPSTTSYAPLETAVVETDLVLPFLQTLTPGAGFRCVALLLLNHLLRDGRGYDARVRQAFKRLAVIVISHELRVGGILRADLDDEEGLDSILWGDGGAARRCSSCDEGDDLDDADELALLATRKFEAMEHAIAAKLISMSGQNKESSPDNKSARSTADHERSRRTQSTRAKTSAGKAPSPSSSTHGRIALAPKETPLSGSQHGISREQLLRGIKVGTAGAVGATLFALTGGLAAPGIAAGLAAVAGTSAIAAGVSTVLSSAAAISTIFGVGGAGLASYKMHRRTKGLTEFNFNKESVRGRDEAELFSTVCISGWLRDARDFQRPWGVMPSQPRIVDKQELLERFYFIHNPRNVFRVGEILKHWKGRYFQLWRALREKYGSDPSNLFPLKEGPRISAELTHEEGEAVDYLLDELGYFPKKKTPKKSPFFEVEAEETSISVVKPKGSPPAEAKKLQSAQKQLKDSSLRPKKWLPDGFSVNGSDIASTTLSLFSETDTGSIKDESTHTAGSAPATVPNKGSKPAADLMKIPPPKHLLTVWDYHANYGGELYTVQWESELLMELCDSVTDQMIEWGISATKTILHTTVFATLMTAVTLPYSLVLAANAIDSSWTMAMERADRAGVELAKSLIDSTAGHRPVILAGFSMGARVIYSCLKELARHQEKWEAHQQKKNLPSTRRKSSKGGDQEDDKLKYMREPASIVEDAILMGTPNHVSLKSWDACRRVVAGRMINCYSRKDLILSLMFQMKRFQGILRPVCGTSPVAVNGVENYDVTDLVSAHTDYCLVSGEILKRVQHGQPQRAAVSKTEVSAMVTTINVANKDIGGFASLSDEAA